MSITWDSAWILACPMDTMNNLVEHQNPHMSYFADQKLVNISKKAIDIVRDKNQWSMFKTVKISHNLLEKIKINIFSYKLVDKFLNKNLYQDELMLQVSTLVRNYKKTT